MTTLPPIYTLCCKCLEPECIHWNSKSVVNRHVKRGILLDSIYHSVDIELKCNCSDKYEHHKINKKYEDLTFGHKYKCHLCKNVFIIDNKPITHNTGRNCRPSNKYPRSKCIECKGAGKKLHETFSKCEDCQGTGGIECTCYRMKCQSCDNCIRGYSKLCYNCKGSKAFINDKEFWKEYDCDMCDEEG